MLSPPLFPLRQEEEEPEDEDIDEDEEEAAPKKRKRADSDEGARRLGRGAFGAGRGPSGGGQLGWRTALPAAAGRQRTAAGPLARAPPSPAHPLFPNCWPPADYEEEDDEEEDDEEEDDE